jgi:hypothetical protein
MGPPKRSAPPTEIGDDVPPGGPPWLLLALGVLFALGVTWYAFRPLDIIPQMTQ